MRGAHAAAGDEEILHVAGLKAAKRNVVVGSVVEILVRGPAPSLLPQLDGPARAGDAIREFAAAQDIFARELITPDHAAALADAHLRGGVGDEGPRERGQCFQKFRDGEGALPPFLLGDRQEVAARG